MRVLITGATGFLGNNLVRALLEQGHEVIAAVRLSSDPRPIAGLEIEKRNLDLSNSGQINLAVQSADLIIHSAALIHVGWTKLAESRKVNVESTRILAAAARRQNIRMIHVSTVDTLATMEGNTPVNEEQFEPAKPNCSYVVSKREAEQVILEESARGLDGVIVNPGFMVGPFDWKPSSGKMMLMLAKQPILFSRSCRRLFGSGRAGRCRWNPLRDSPRTCGRAVHSGRQKYELPRIVAVDGQSDEQTPTGEATVQLVGPQRWEDWRFVRQGFPLRIRHKLGFASTGTDVSLVQQRKSRKGTRLSNRRCRGRPARRLGVV